VNYASTHLRTMSRHFTRAVLVRGVREIAGEASFRAKSDCPKVTIPPRRATFSTRRRHSVSNRRAALHFRHQIFRNRRFVSSVAKNEGGAI
jgi:hypothetical protein